MLDEHIKNCWNSCPCDNPIHISDTPTYCLFLTPSYDREIYITQGQQFTALSLIYCCSSLTFHHSSQTSALSFKTKPSPYLSYSVAGLLSCFLSPCLGTLPYLPLTTISLTRTWSGKIRPHICISITSCPTSLIHNDNFQALTSGTIAKNPLVYIFCQHILSFSLYWNISRLPQTSL